MGLRLVASDAQGGLRSSGGHPAHIVVEAFCECGWVGRPLPWRPGAGRAEQEELAAHLADSGHQEFPIGVPPPDGHHVDCGHFHQLNDACPVPADINEPATAGRISDLIRRTFGLPTPPPEATTAGLIAGTWLADAINAAEAATTPVSWDELAALHPAMRAAAHAAIPVPADHLEDIAPAASEAWSWTQLARQAAQPGWLSRLLPPGAGGWMDEGILSRWVLDTLAPLDTLVVRVTPRITPAALRRLHAVLATSGLSRPTGG